MLPGSGKNFRERPENTYSTCLNRVSTYRIIFPEKLHGWISRNFPGPWLDVNVRRYTSGRFIITARPHSNYSDSCTPRAIHISQRWTRKHISCCLCRCLLTSSILASAPFTVRPEIHFWPGRFVAQLLTGNTLLSPGRQHKFRATPLYAAVALFPTFRNNILNRHRQMFANAQRKGQLTVN